MRVYACRIECFRLHEEGTKKISRVFVPAEMTDSGLLIVECQEGHRTACILRQRKYHILFVSGAAALLDSYTNEAISSFNTALECHYQYYINVICKQYSIDPELTEKVWKTVYLSERWFGAFCFLYALVSKSNYEPLPSELTKLRNKVIHTHRLH